MGNTSVIPPSCPCSLCPIRGVAAVIIQNLMRMKEREGGRERDRRGERKQESVWLMPCSAGETGAEQAMRRRGEVRGEDRQHICPLPLWAVGAPTPPWLVMPAQVWGSSSAGTLAAGPRVPPHSSLSRPCWSTIHHPGQNRPWKQSDSTRHGEVS